MELLCASVVQPTLMSIQYQCFGWDLKREQVHMQEHRTGARGNFTAFQLPWEDIYSKFAKLQKLKEEDRQPQLPRSGKDLHEMVQVRLYVSGDINTHNADILHILRGRGRAGLKRPHYLSGNSQSATASNVLGVRVTIRGVRVRVRVRVSRSFYFVRITQRRDMVSA